MPILILMARLCPPGAEGTTYALVTSVRLLTKAHERYLAEHQDSEMMAKYQNRETRCSVMPSSTVLTLPDGHENIDRAAHGF